MHEESTVRPRSLDPVYIVTYYITWGKTSWTYSISISKSGIREYFIRSIFRIFSFINPNPTGYVREICPIDFLMSKSSNVFASNV